jgi:hypothetical protein
MALIVEPPPVEDDPIVPFRVFRLQEPGDCKSRDSAHQEKPLAGAMSRKSFIMLAMIIGSTAGGFVPIMFGADSIAASLVGSTIGGLLGIWGAFKLS